MAAKRSSSRRFSRWLRRRGLGALTALALVLLIVAYAAVLELARPHVSGERLRFDSFVQLLQDGRIQNAHILDEDAYVVGTYLLDTAPSPAQPAPTTRSSDDDGLRAVPRPSVAPAPDGGVAPYNAPLIRGTQRDLLRLLLENGVPITVDQQVGKRVAALASILLPSLILVVLFAYLILSYRRGTGLFGIRSGARRITAEEGGVRFADVAGQDAAVAELQEIKGFLSDPERFAAIGADVPKGVLLYGPPGCGKTMLAKALATEAGASFYSISGSDFVELYVGVGASRVRELFREARENAPALIFIDELDSIGRARGTVGTVASHGEQDQALNQILAEMDGFSKAQGVIVVGATNRPDILDQALLRPGRFDRTVGLERPDERARLAILEVHAKRKHLSPEVDLAAIANRAIGLTGADLASVMNEAALLAARAGRDTVAQPDLDAALHRILEAPERQRRLSLRERSIGRRFSAEDRVTFADVAGVDDAITELAEVRDYLADPDRFAAIGARVPRGILLSGPPGCGKTLLARAVAGEANAAFLSVAASEFVEVFVGEGASRVRELFAEAASVAPAIVFIDEIDAIGSHRGGAADGNREREQTLNQILVELDGFDARAGVIVMAATNRPDILDAALVRPGRFDRHVNITLPDREGRRRILDLHAGAKHLGPDVDLDVVAGLTRGFSGADLANVLNEAALLAGRRGLSEVSMELVEEGIERAAVGVASRGVVLSEQEREVAAYHEAGHAVVAAGIGANTPRRLSIMTRGGVLGRCTTMEAHDTVLPSQPTMVDDMAVLLGGWAAEKLAFGYTSAGIASDIERVGDLARRMVREYGMSEALGPLDYPEEPGADGRPRAYSEEVARLIDTEVRRLVDEAGDRAGQVLGASRPQLDAVARALVERETITADELAALTSRPRPQRLTTAGG